MTYPLKLFRSLLAGITAGVLVGSIVGAAVVIANGYLDGYPALALGSFRLLLNRNTLATVLLFVQIEITYLLIATALARFRRRTVGARRSNAVLWIVVATGFALWSLQETLWLPRARSARGALLFLVVALAGAGAARFVARNQELLRSGVAASLRGLGAAAGRPGPPSSCWRESTSRPRRSSFARPGPGSTSPATRRTTSGRSPASATS